MATVTNREVAENQTFTEVERRALGFQCSRVRVKNQFPVSVEAVTEMTDRFMEGKPARGWSKERIQTRMMQYHLYRY